MMITGYPTVEGAVEAVKTGAEKYLSKPFTDEELFAAVGQARADWTPPFVPFAARFAEEIGRSSPHLSDRALQVLRNYYWPEDVRELENVIQRLVVMTDGDLIEVPDLPPLMRCKIQIGRRPLVMKRILVAIDDAPVSEEVVRIASKLAKSDGAKVFVAYVYEVPRALPLDAEIPEEMEKADKVLDSAAAMAEEMGLEVETDLIQARAAGPGIVEEAKDLGADLIVIGMSTKPKIGDVIFGSTALYVLRRARCQVIIVRQSLK